MGLHQQLHALLVCNSERVLFKTYFLSNGLEVDYYCSVHFIRYTHVHHVLNVHSFVMYAYENTVLIFETNANANFCSRLPVNGLLAYGF